MHREPGPEQRASSLESTAAHLVPMECRRVTPPRGYLVPRTIHRGGAWRRLAATLLLTPGAALAVLACASGDLDGAAGSGLGMPAPGGVRPSSPPTIIRPPAEAPRGPSDDASSELTLLRCESRGSPSPPTSAARNLSPQEDPEADPYSSTPLSYERVVDVQRTPLSGKEAAKRLERAYRRLIGRRPSRETIELLTAHWAHETNQGASMLNYNFGGIKGVGPDGAYVVTRTREGAGARTRSKNHRFRAYADATDGALDYLSLLRRLYRPALEAAALGDATGFVEGLKAGGYFSGDETVYLKKVTTFMGFAREWGLEALGPSGISPRHRASRPPTGTSS